MSLSRTFGVGVYSSSTAAVSAVSYSHFADNECFSSYWLLNYHLMCGAHVSHLYCFVLGSAVVVAGSVAKVRHIKYEILVFIIVYVLQKKITFCKRSSEIF